MTPKQEREWAKGILERLDANVYGTSLQFFAECRGLVNDFAEGKDYTDKPLARRLTDIFENVIWLREFQDGKITKEEFWKRIDDKAKAMADKRMDAFKKSLDRKLNPPRKKRKKRTTSGR